ncbi:MAG: L,D-transpeptidase [Lachnospiraceae bacterium]|nr:L,D-transpeptidase [Lachnospiraceae bacterium]
MQKVRPRFQLVGKVALVFVPDHSPELWAPFNGGQGLHDAPWRSDFGGDIYLSNGSHGCVNIPPENMEAIYNAIDIGTAVVIY